MRCGVTGRAALLRALQNLGGVQRKKGGETVVWFPGTTVIVGRRDFSRAMLKRVCRKIASAGITEEELRDALAR